MKKLKQDILILPLTKSGDISLNRNTNIRRHQCDILITDNHTPNGFTVVKNRNPFSNGLPHRGSITYKELLALGQLFPRKKKKAYKNRIINEYGWMAKIK